MYRGNERFNSGLESGWKMSFERLSEILLIGRNCSLSPKTGSGIKPDQLERAAMRARTMALQSFSKQTLFGPDVGMVWYEL